MECSKSRHFRAYHFRRGRRVGIFEICYTTATAEELTERETENQLIKAVPLAPALTIDVIVVMSL